jgi:hypothetical protein
MAVAQRIVLLRPLVARCLAALFALHALTVSGAALEEGMEAYNAQDYVRALQLWRPLAEQGDPDAQFYVATLYAEGKGVSESDLIAAVWYQRAAEQGVAMAQYNLGVSYAEGLGVRKDEAAAAKWFRRAADQGNAYAQLNLGLLHAAGRGVPQDKVEAVKWIELSVFGLPPGAARSDAARALKDVAETMTDEELLKARTAQRDFRAKPEARPSSPRPSAGEPSAPRPAAPGAPAAKPDPAGAPAAK